MGKMSERADRIANGLRDMPMSTFNNSRYGKKSLFGKPETPKLSAWIRSGHFDKEDEQFLVDFPDHVPDQPEWDQTFASDIAKRYNKHGADMFVTQDQLAHIKRIIEKHCR